MTSELPAEHARGAGPAWREAIGRAAFEQSPVSMVVYDAEGRLVAVNPAFERLWGVTMHDAPPGYSVLTDPELERAGVLPLIRRAFDGEPVTLPAIRYDIAAVGPSRRGRTLWTQAHLYALRGADGRVELVVLTQEDVTEEREAELALEAQNQQLQEQAMELEAQTEELHETTAELLERTDEALAARAEAEAAAAQTRVLQQVTAALAGATTVTAVTDVIVSRALPALGASTGMLALLTPDGTGLELVSAANIPKDIAAAFRRYPVTLDAPLAEAAREGHAITLGSRAEMLERFPLRAELWERFDAHTAYVAPVLREGRVLAAMMFMWRQPVTVDERVTRFVTVLTDQCALAIERARLLDAERAARESAEAANAAKSDFLSKMSHELRTPLNAVGGYVDLLAMGIRGPVTEAQHADLARVKRAQQYLLSIINDLLDFARLDAGRVDIRLADVDLGPLIEDLDALVGAQLNPKGIVYTRDPGSPPSVRADPEKVRQILVNLLSNALKFTGAGGRIAVSWSEEPALGADGARGTSAVVRIRVSDTGRGIPADKLERIFEPFVQLDRDLTQGSQQGVGLGLSISRELARAMGGDLTAESVAGAGSTFTLTLPAA